MCTTQHGGSGHGRATCRPFFVTDALKPSELREVERLVRLNRKLLPEAWDDFFGR